MTPALSPLAPWRPVIFALTTLLLGVGCDGTDPQGFPPASSSISVSQEGTVPAAAAASTEVTVRIRVTHSNGSPLAGMSPEWEIVAGGGTMQPGSNPTNDEGVATLTWVLGPAPIRQKLEVRVAMAGPLTFIVDALEAAAPITPESFGGIEQFLVDSGETGSTEGLAFDGMDRLILGAPGGLIAISPGGIPTWIETIGDPIIAPLGMAFDRAGGLWIADTGGDALRHMGPDGTVTTPLSEWDGAPFKTPNTVAVGPDGIIHLTDSCRGVVLAFDPVAGKVIDSFTLNLDTEGGPNGLAFDAVGALWFTTENVALLCAAGTTTAAIDSEQGSLMRVDFSDGMYGTVDVVEGAIGLFGDGLGFDTEGNLYGLFDTQKDFALEASLLMVLPAGEQSMRVVTQVADRIFANIAFGGGAFGSTKAYLALLAVPPLATERGVERIDLGVEGALLLP